MISISYYHPVTYKCLIVYKLLDDGYSSISLMKSLGFVVLDINIVEQRKILPFHVRSFYSQNINY